MKAIVWDDMSVEVSEAERASTKVRGWALETAMVWADMRGVKKECVSVATKERKKDEAWVSLSAKALADEWATLMALVMAPEKGKEWGVVLDVVWGAVWGVVLDGV